MLDRYAYLYVQATSSLSSLADWWGEPMSGPMVGDTPEEAMFKQNRLEQSKKVLEATRQLCVLAGFDGVLHEVTRLETVIAARFPFGQDRKRDFEALERQMTNELKSESFFHVERRDAPLYGQNQPFGELVSDKFPLATEDLRSAGDCLALRQPTAAVFHLMRAMEVIVQRLAKRLKIKNIDRVWGMLLSDIDTAIKAMPRGAKKDRWSEARANLYHVKQAWRNDTMHPKQTYTQDQAREVFNAMGTFARQLATLV